MNNELSNMVNEFKSLNENILINKTPEYLDELSETEIMNDAFESIDTKDWSECLSEDYVNGSENINEEIDDLSGKMGIETTVEGVSSKTKKNMLLWIITKTINAFVGLIKKTPKLIDLIISKCANYTDMGLDSAKQYFNAITKDIPFIALFLTTFTQAVTYVITTLAKFISLSPSLTKGLIILILHKFPNLVIPAAILLIVLSLVFGPVAGIVVFNKFLLNVLITIFITSTIWAALDTLFRTYWDLAERKPKIYSRLRDLFSTTFLKGFLSDTLKIIKSMKLSNLKAKFDKNHENIRNT